MIPTGRAKRITNTKRKGEVNIISDKRSIEIGKAVVTGLYHLLALALDHGIRRGHTKDPEIGKMIETATKVAVDHAMIDTGMKEVRHMTMFIISHMHLNLLLWKKQKPSLRGLNVRKDDFIFLITLSMNNSSVVTTTFAAAKRSINLVQFSAQTIVSFCSPMKRGSPLNVSDRL